MLLGLVLCGRGEETEMLGMLKGRASESSGRVPIQFLPTDRLKSLTKMGPRDSAMGNDLTMHAID